VFFQDQSKRLIYLNETWTPTVLPVDPIVGTPISTSIVDNIMHVFYISAKDNCMHYVAQERGGSWSDKIMTSCTFEEKLKRFMVAPNQETGNFEAYVLTEDNALLQLTPEGEGVKRELGKVDKTGKFLAGTSAECCRYVWSPVVVYVRRRVRCCYCW